MRRDNRRKAKRKSFEADKRTRSRSNSINDIVPKKSEEEDLKDDEEEEQPLVINEEDPIEKNTNHIKTEYEKFQILDEAGVEENQATNKEEKQNSDAENDKKETPPVNGKHDPSSDFNVIHCDSDENDKDKEDEANEILDKDPKLHQKLLSKVTNEAMMRLYSR